MQPQPNIVFIITHDTGRHLGCCGRSAESPTLDKLASEGVLFEQHFCTAPQCSPSRGSIITGKWPHSHGLIGLTHRGFGLNNNQPFLPQLLADNGYNTNLYGFQHESKNPEELGYRYIYRPEKGNSCIHVTPAFIDFLKTQPQEPFYASVGFSETHRQFQHVDADLEKIEPLPYLPDDQRVRQDVADINGLVKRVDNHVDMILKTLDAAGLAKNTIVIFSTDHGIAFPRAKATLFDPGVETALIMKIPNAHRGKCIKALTSHIDIAPTILELASVNIPEQMQGASMMPLINGEAESIHDELFFEMTFHAAYDPMRAVRTEQFKYIRSFRPRTFAVPSNIDDSQSKEMVKELGWFEKGRAVEQLYDLKSDPYEQKNIAESPKYASVLKTMRDKLNSWMATTGDFVQNGGHNAPENAQINKLDAYSPSEERIQIDPDSVLD